MLAREVLAAGIFSLVYLIILAGENSPRKLDRPAAGLIGGVLMVVCGVLTRQEAVSAIDFGTLALLFGMMVVVQHAVTSGLLDRLAYRLVTASRTADQMLWSLCWGAGILSALFVNDTVCLLMTPLVLAATRRARLPAEPFLLALATSSNVGSVMTVTGNPQNMLIGQSSHWTWAAFAARMVPIGIVCLVINGLVLKAIYHRQLPPGAITLDGPAEPTALDRRLATKTVLVLLGLLLAFLLGAPMDVAALSAAVVMLVLANRPPEKTFAAVDWSLLLFFAGLFVVAAGVTKAEAAWIGRLLPEVTRQVEQVAGLLRFSAASVAGSNLFSNVPFVMLLRGWIAPAPHAELLWLCLAASSTLAGNLTLVGSAANLIVAHGAQAEHPLSFWAFLRVGILSTALTVLASTLMLWLFSRLGCV
ncbi:MAG: anion transporter [Armatimonadetes bacterium]|jgi:Na+/H+ antiporter NhaD/arsenite permease-like protein|nr:anion transporter [Armatimonadota bacterium]